MSRRTGSGRLLALACASAAAAAVVSVLIRAPGCGFVATGQATFPSARLQSHGPAPGSRAEGLARRAFGGNRVAYIAVVEAQVKEGQEDAFLEASLENARNSKREDSNQRFDVLQSQTDSSKFALVEIYRAEKGPVDHKASEHYAAWRDAVADMMEVPRSATQWDTIFPSRPSSYAPSGLILERGPGMETYFDISHIFVDVKPGREQDFIDLTVKTALTSIPEVTCHRFDVLQSVDDSTKFLIQQVWRDPSDLAFYKATDNYLRWDGAVANMQAKSRVVKKWVNHFPTVAVGWTTPDGTQ